MCMHGVNDEERRVSVEGLDPEQLEEFLQARESLGNGMHPVNRTAK